MAEYLLPNDSKAILLKENNRKAIYNNPNLHLVVNKLIDVEAIVNKIEFKISKKDGKGNETKELGKLVVKDWQNTASYRVLLPHLQKRNEQVAKGIFGEADRRAMMATTAARVAIGLGGASIYETGISLHHIYGIPYLPGTALKGVVRSYIIQECFQSKEEKAFQDRGFCLLFGSDDAGITKARKGAVTVLDAFPQKFKLNLDVMTPHYKDYYGGKDFPKDTDAPNPIAFIVVEDMVCKIHFGLVRSGASGTKIDGGIFAGRECLEVVETYLKKALEEYGIGAKTSAGYGYCHCKCAK